jgi:hypothetical protein
MKTSKTTTNNNKRNQQYRIATVSDAHNPIYRHMTLKEAQRTLFLMFLERWDSEYPDATMPSNWGQAVTRTKHAAYDLQAVSFSDGTRAFSILGETFQIYEDDWIDRYVVLNDGEYEDQFDTEAEAEALKEQLEQDARENGTYEEGVIIVMRAEEVI